MAYYFSYFYRLNETSPTNVTQEYVKDFALEGIDNDNIEISEAIETLKQEQQKYCLFSRKMFTQIKI